MGKHYGDIVPLRRSITRRLSLPVAASIILLSTGAVYPLAASGAEEARVFTNDDLVSNAEMASGVDEETLARKEEDLRNWRRKRDVELRDEDRRRALLEQGRRETARRRRSPSDAVTGSASTAVPGTASGMGEAVKAAGMTGAAPAAGGPRKPT